jgi:uncharacterized membrane protein
MTLRRFATAFTVSASLGLAIGGSAFAGPPSFTPIPGLPGDNPAGSRALGLSGDGRTVVGEVRTVGRWEAMIWTRAGGTRALGPGFFSAASYDGSVAVGATDNGNVWRAGSGWQTLAGPPGAGSAISGLGVSGDGSTIVGTARDSASITHAVRWTAAGGAQFLPWPDQVGTGLWAVRPSDDGTRVAGTYSFGASRAFEWSITGGSRFIDAPITTVFDMTPDAQYVVGEGGDAGYIWSRTTGAFAIPRLPGRQGGAAMGISADGGVVVGRAGTSPAAYIWDAVNGSRLLADVLAQHGVSLGGFTLLEATRISADGQTIAGLGRNAQGIQQSWIATVPSPSAAGTLAGAAGLAALRRRRPAAQGTGSRRI